MSARVLLLGGTSDANTLANALSVRGIDAIYSYAGRVAAPRAQRQTTRVGGFGGVDGLTTFLLTNGITHLVDATHPFAATISGNAIRAAQQAGIPLIALTRPPWEQEPQDRWTRVADISMAPGAIGPLPRRIFLAIGRQHLAEFSDPAHRYLLRLVDPPGPATPLPPNCDYVVERGPFSFEHDRSLLRQYQIDLVVAKNAGGTATIAKIDAARDLGIEVIMIDRPDLPQRHEVHDASEVLAWLDHAGTDLGV